MRLIIQNRRAKSVKLNIHVAAQLIAQTVQEILRGGYAKAYEAGAIIAGGHTIQGAEPIYGLAVTGFVHPDKVLTNAAARPGDALILTKPLGVGILTTAAKAELVDRTVLERLRVHLVDINFVMQSLRSQNRRLHFRADGRVWRNAGKLCVALRPVGRLGDGASEAGGAHHQNGLIGLGWNDRLVGGVGLHGPPRRAVGLHQDKVRQRRQTIHGQLQSAPLVRFRDGGASRGQPSALERLVQLPVRRGVQIDQSGERINFRGGTQQDSVPRFSQLLPQRAQKGGFFSAADDSGDAPADLKCLSQFHNGYLTFQEYYT